MRTKAISRKLAKRKAELESEAYQVGSFRGASLERVGLIEAARGQCRQTAVFSSGFTGPGRFTRARAVRALIGQTTSQTVPLQEAGRTGHC